MASIINKAAWGTKPLLQEGDDHAPNKAKVHKNDFVELQTCRSHYTRDQPVLGLHRELAGLDLGQASESHLQYFL